MHRTSPQNSFEKAGYHDQWPFMLETVAAAVSPKWAWHPVRTSVANARSVSLSRPTLRPLIQRRNAQHLHWCHTRAGKRRSFQLRRSRLLSQPLIARLRTRLSACQPAESRLCDWSRHPFHVATEPVRLAWIVDKPLTRCRRWPPGHISLTQPKNITSSINSHL